jgi:GNAT superfamily N-acetyltransferase
MKSVISPTYLHFHDLASHFLALTAGDRFLRFGWVMSDVDIVDYVERLLRSIGNVFVVVEPARDISGVLHLEFDGSGADLGLSVSAWARGRGVGSLLLERARLMASAHNIRTLFVRNLNFNTALRRLAHAAGMRVACAPTARSTRLEVPAARGGFTPPDPLACPLTLADHSLRFQWARAGDAPGARAGALYAAVAE